MIYKNIEDIEFHDLILVDLYIDFKTREIKFIVEIYDEEEKEYFQLSLLFLGVSQIYTDGVIGNMENAEIYSCDIENISNRNQIKFIIRFDIGEPGLEIGFDFLESVLVALG